MIQDVVVLTIVAGAFFVTIAGWRKQNAMKAKKNCSGCDGCPIISECHDTADGTRSIMSDRKL